MYIYLKIFCLILLFNQVTCQYGNYPGYMCGLYSTTFNLNITCNGQTSCPPNFQEFELLSDIFTCVNIGYTSDSLYQGSLCGNYPLFPCGEAAVCPYNYEQYKDQNINTCYTTISNQQSYAGMICGINNKFSCQGNYPNTNCPIDYKQSMVYTSYVCVSNM